MKSSFSKIILATFLFGTVASASYTTPSDIYKSAILNSTKVNSSKLAYEAKKEGLGEVYGQLYPQLEGSLGYSMSDYERNEMAGRVRDPQVTETSKEISLTLNQVIYNPALNSSIDIEKERVKLFSYDYDLKKQEIAREALDVYMSVLNIKNRISLLRANMNYIAQNQKMIEEKYAMNLVTKMDFLKVQVEYQKSKIDLIQEEKNYDAMYLKLQNVTKMDDILIPDFNLSNLSETYIKNILLVLENNNSLDRNLSILQARSAVQVSSYEVSHAKDGHLPDLSLSASYTKYVSKDETTDYNHYGRAMVKLRIPIFEGGAVSAKVSNKQLMKRSMEEELRTVEDDIRLKLNEDVNLLKSEIDTLRMYKDALVSGEVYLESVQLAYDKGLKSIVDLFDAKNKLFEIKYDYIKSIHEMSNLFVAFLINTNSLDELYLIDELVKQEGVK